MNKFILMATSLLFIGILTVPHHAYMQSTGSIRGKVRAKDGSELPGVTVIIRENQTGQTSNTTTDDSGDYQLNNLPTGTYLVTFTKDGFKRGRVRDVIVFANRTTECNHFEMELDLSVNTDRHLSGIELMQVTRVAHGGGEYAGLQYLTARSEGFVNVGPFAAVGLGAGGVVAAQVEVKVNITDYQDRQIRRRLDVSATGPVMGPTFLVYTGTEGGGMFLGNQFRVSEVAASRQWAMMGFGTLNRAAEGNLPAYRQHDELYKGEPHYVVEVRFNPSDVVRFWISKRTFLTSRVVTRYNSTTMVEEDRSDYHKVSCLMLPFRIVTKLRGQRLADLTIDSYDIQTVLPTARFTMVAGE